MCMCEPEWMHVPHVHTEAQTGQKRALGLLKLELQVVVNCHTGSFWKPNPDPLPRLVSNHQPPRVVILVVLIFKFQSIKNPHWLSRQMTQMGKGTWSPACPPEFYPRKPPPTPSKRRKLTSEKSFSLRTCTHANVILKFQHSSNDIQCLWPSQESALTYTIKNKNKLGMAAHVFNPKVNSVYKASSRTGKTT